MTRYLRARNPAEAEDLAADTWVDVVRALRRFRGDEDHFRALLFTVARRRVIDETRRRHRRRTDPVADAGADIAGPGAPEHDVIENDATRRLSALVDRLPPDQADVIRLRVLAGLDTEVVSEILGKSAGAIRVIQHRALRRLAELVGAPAEKKA